MMASAAPEAPAAFAAIASKVAKPKVSKASFTAKLPPVRNATLRTGKSNAVVQLGAYGSRERVATAWTMLTKRYPALRGHVPVTARFDGPKGTVYRLSVQGFASDGDARDFCEALQGAGASCFVRSVAGDAPVRLASL